MSEHIKFAKEMQVPYALRIQDGDIVRIYPGKYPEIVDKAPSGRMYLDGSIAVGENSQSIKERKNLSLNGYLEITLILSNSGKLSKPIISYRILLMKKLFLKWKMKFLIHADHFL